MFCSKCSAKIPDGSLFCPECGQKLVSAAQSYPQGPQVRQQPQYVPPRERQTRVSPVVQPVSDPLRAPLSTGNFFWMPVLIGIPLVGLILLLVWAFSKDVNVNRKNYARSVLIWILVTAILAVLAVLAGGGLAQILGNALSSL